MSDKINKEQLNEILKQRLGNLDKIEDKAMFLRQPPSSLTNQTITSITANAENNNQTQLGSSDNKKDKI